MWPAYPGPIRPSRPFTAASPPPSGSTRRPSPAGRPRRHETPDGQRGRTGCRWCEDGRTMVRRPPSASSIAITASILGVFVGWTLLVQFWAPLAAFDQRAAPPPITLASPAGQIASAISFVTWPGIPYAILLCIAVWALRRRLRQLALALALTIVLAWGGGAGLKLLIGRPRPDGALPLLTSTGLSYPSGHMVGIVAFSVAIGATLMVTRERVTTKFF